MNNPKAVFPGSFDPFSLAHHELVINVSELFDVTILICVNPEKNAGMFTPEERCQIIKHAFIEYYNFVNESVFSLLSFAHLRFHLPGLNWAIPVGISFFTFQALGYYLDVYHKRISVEKKLIDYLLFVSFFRDIHFVVQPEAISRRNL